MKLYKALLGNCYVHGTKHVVFMHIQDAYSNTIGEVRVIYEIKKTPGLSLEVQRGHFIKCYVEVRDGVTTKRTEYGTEQCYNVLGSVELIKGNIQEMLLSYRDEKKARQVFLASTTHSSIDALLNLFGSFRFLNSTILFNIPASMMQIL